MKNRKWLLKALTFVVALMIGLTSSFAFTVDLNALEKDTKVEESQSRANVTITSEKQLLTLKDVYGVHCFTDAAWRSAVFKAVKNGQDNAVGTSIEDALNNFRGDIIAKNKGIVNVRGLDLLRNANHIDLRHNEIKDLSYLGQNTGDIKYKEWFANNYGDIDERDSGGNVSWDLGGNPFEKLPENFGGNLEIQQAGTTSYTYPDNSGGLYTYLRSSMINGEASGKINVNKTKINKSGVWVNATIDSVSSLAKAPYIPLKITGYDHLRNDIATFSGLTKTGMAKLAVGIDQELQYWTEDEYGTSTPGSQSFKYYLTQRFQVYDKVTIHDNYNVKVKLEKKDSADASFVAGAKYKLFYSDGTPFNDKEYTTDVNGVTEEISLPLGSYYFKETAAPEGYLINQNKVEFKVEVPANEVATTLSGGKSEITTTDLNKTEKSNGNQRFVVAPIKDASGNVITEGSAPIALIKHAGSPVNSVAVTYKKLDVNGVANTNVVKTFGSLQEAQSDINTQINNNKLLGEVLVEVSHGATTATTKLVETEDTKIEKIDIKVTKNWVGDNDAWLDAPGNKHPDITINLFRNGKKIEYTPVVGDKAKLVEVSFNDLYKTDQYGKEYVYSVSEDPIIAFGSNKEGYATSILFGDSLKEFTINNNWSVSDRVNIKGIKQWDDMGNILNKRPDHVKIILMQDGKHYSTSIASKDNEWEFHFNNVPEYAHDEKTGQNGEKHIYTIKEEAVEGYESFEEVPIEVSGYTNGATITLPKGTIVNTITNKRSLNETEAFSGVKVWEDYSDVYKKRPSSIEVELLRNNQAFGVKQTIQADENGIWTYSFTGLEKYDMNGMEYVYSIRENNVPDHYAVSYAVENIINTIDHVDHETSILGYKVWEDNNDKAGIRPDKIDVVLLQNGKEYKREEVSGKGKFPWRYYFQSLPTEDENGKEYVYTVKEVKVPKGYVSTVSSDNTKITNKLTNKISPPTGDTGAPFKRTLFITLVLSAGYIIMKLSNRYQKVTDK